MTALAFDRNLRQDGNETTAFAAGKTHAGQADFAGSGPAGTVCSQCRYWQDFNTKKLKARCRKFQDLQHGRSGPEFPGSAQSCQFFEVRK
jgi:hypothetical protein